MRHIKVVINSTHPQGAVLVENRFGRFDWLVGLVAESVGLHSHASIMVSDSDFEEFAAMADSIVEILPMRDCETCD